MRLKIVTFVVMLVLVGMVLLVIVVVVVIVTFGSFFRLNLHLKLHFSEKWIYFSFSSTQKMLEKYIKWLKTGLLVAVSCITSILIE